ncbi:MAG: hypothetical protein E6H51_03245 [Betaproteobacteria bacterium]|nr:MAG: hypothetical protein E6H51_03245 [Betaproteobacteria bacterium]
MSRKAVSRIYFALVLSVSAVTNAISNDTAIAVRWDETIYPDNALKAASTKDFKTLLDANWHDAMSVVVRKDKGPLSEKSRLQNCRQLFGIERYLYGTEDPTDWPILMQSLLRCKAMEIMTRLQPSKVSYVNMDVQSMVPDLAKLRLLSDSDPVRTFFSGLKEKATETKCFHKDSCRVVTKKDAYLLSLVGAGDYNGDGIEDVILIAGSRPVRGTATSGLSLGFVMTREAPDKPLKILSRFEKAN